MTKKALQKQIDELKSALLLHAVRIEALEARPYNIFTYPQPYVPLQTPCIGNDPLPFPGSTVTCGGYNEAQYVI